MDYLKEIKEFHKQNIEIYEGKTIGCTEEEIAILEKEIGFKLPLSYKQYLLWMGHDYKGIFVGSDWFITSVLENTKYTASLLKSNKLEYILPKNYLSFFGHQGYNYAWFSLPKRNDNPEVYFWGEGQDLLKPKIVETFTKFLFDDMKELAVLLPILYNKL